MVNNFSTASSDASASSLTDTVGTITVPKHESTNSADSCTWYGNGICSAPRSCYDCLNTPLANDNCAIKADEGTCALVGSMVSLTIENGSGYGIDYFPTSNYTYCPIDDTTCTICKEMWANKDPANETIPSTAICFGEGGCICLASCEAPTRSLSIVSSLCSVVHYGMTAGNLIKGIAIALGVFGGFILLGFCVQRWAKARGIANQLHEEEQRRQRLRIVRPPPSGPQLSLSGWTSMRDKLVEIEVIKLSGIGPLSIARANGESNTDNRDSWSRIEEGGYRLAPTTPR